MASSVRQPGFRATTAALTLTGAAGMIFAGSWLTMRTFFSADRFVLTTLVFGAVVVWVGTLLGLLPVILLGPRGVMPTVYGYFIGTGLRLLLVMGAAMTVVHTGRLPGRPMAVVLAVFYLPLLMIEVGLVGRYLWQKDLPGRADDGARPAGINPPEVAVQ